jgi:hypothetical protein
MVNRLCSNPSSTNEPSSTAESCFCDFAVGLLCELELRLRSSFAIFLVCLFGLWLLAGCVSVAERPESSLALSLDSFTLPTVGDSTSIAWDSQDIRTTDGLPLIAFRSFRNIRLVVEGTPPSHGRLLIRVSGRADTPGWAVADLSVAQGEPIPQRNVLDLWGTIDENGIPGSDWIARALRDAALGGGSGRYPEYYFALAFRWLPADGAPPSPMTIERVELSCTAAPAVALFGPDSL